MDPARIIARLDVKSHNVVKGIHLEGLRVMGQPGDLARQYYAHGVDELLFMDVVASLYGRNNLLPVVMDAAKDVFVPLTVGGGIRSLDDIFAVLRAGADKVAINTEAVARPEIIREAAQAFGSQCIVLSVEAKFREGGWWEALTDNGRQTTGRNVMEWIKEAESLGAGELLITSVDQEGTRKGFDLGLAAEVRKQIKIPVIFCGGAGAIEDVADILVSGKVDAVCCASIFHYGICRIPDLKRALMAKNLDVRL